MTQDQREINRKQRVFNIAKEIGNASKACHFHKPSHQFYTD
jgi:hypothetical protein